MGLAAKDFRDATAIWKKATADQSSLTTAVLRNANATVKQLSQSASAVETSSTALLNELTRDANEQNSQLSETQEQVRLNLRDLQTATGELRRTLQTADAQIGNPAIAETLQNVDRATANAADGLDQATKSLTDVRQVADKFRETYLKPVNVFWAGFEKLLGIGPPIVTAIK